MNRIFLFLISTLLILSSCTYKEKPTFIKVEDIIIEKATAKEIIINCNAFFENHNDIGGTLSTNNIDIYSKEILLGKLKTEEFNVPAKDTFSIPLTAKITTSKLLEQQSGGLLNNLINIVNNKKIPLTLKGDLVFKKGPFSYTYLIDKTTEVGLKW